MTTDFLCTLGTYYKRLEVWVCGQHPNVRPWHFQWLATKDLYSDLSLSLPTLSGSVLDVGCGSQPYRKWMTSISTYTGIDSLAGPGVDHVVVDGSHWPFPNESFDSVLCTQVLEHVRDVDFVRQELARVLKPGGTLVVTVPFLYNVHGAPEDFRRFTLEGLVQFLSKLEAFEILEKKRQGGIGSTTGILILNYLESITSRCVPLAILKGVCVPVWWLLCGLVNAIGMGLDACDGTERFYSNILVVARKR